MRMRLIIAAIVALAALVALPPLVSGAIQGKLKAKLDGAQEVPDAGDPDGSGTAKVTVKVAERKLCAKISFEGIADPSAAHVHKGKKGVSGPLAIGRWAETQTSSPVRTCATSQKRSLLRKIARKPRNYYVNLHNSAYPAGAIRGQLKKR